MQRAANNANSQPFPTATARISQIKDDPAHLQPRPEEVHEQAQVHAYRAQILQASESCMKSALSNRSVLPECDDQGHTTFLRYLRPFALFASYPSFVATRKEGHNANNANSQPFPTVTAGISQIKDDPAYLQPRPAEVHEQAQVHACRANNSGIASCMKSTLSNRSSLVECHDQGHRTSLRCLRPFALFASNPCFVATHKEGHNANNAKSRKQRKQSGLSAATARI
jgi:hypothetical protein